MVLPCPNRCCIWDGHRHTEVIIRSESRKKGLSFAVGKRPHTLDLRLRHGRHAASVCLLLDFAVFGDVSRCCIVDGGGEIGVAVVVGVDSCERSGELEGIERASMLPGNVGYPTARCCAY